MQKQGKLVYRVVVSVGFLSATYQRDSNLAFPSPVGTNICLDCEDEHLEGEFHIAEVFDYEHVKDYERGVGFFLGDLVMSLIVASTKPNEPADFRVKPECYPEFREQMLDAGWQVSEESSELRPKET